METGGQLVGRGVQAVGQKVLAPFKESTLKSQTVEELAKSKRVDLTPAEITGSRPLSLVESALSFTPGSSGVMQRQKMKQLEELVTLRENLLNKISEGRINPRSLEQVGMDVKGTIDDVISGVKTKSAEESIVLKNNILRTLGSNETYESLGMTAQQVMAKRSSEIAKKGEALYNRVWQSVKEDISLPSFQKTANDFLKKELAKPESLQNKQLVSVLEDLSGGKSPYNLEAYAPEIRSQIEAQLKEQAIRGYSPQTIQGIRSELNDRIISHDMAYKVQQGGGQKMIGTAEGGVYKQLRKSLENDLDKYFKETGTEEAKKTWDVAQAFWREGKQTFNNPAILRTMKTNPEKVIDMVFTPGSVTPIQQLKRAVGDTEFNNLKQGFTSKIFDKAAKGEFSWEKISKELDRYGDQTLGQIYSPQEIASLRKAISQGIKTDNPFIDPYLQKLLRHSSPETLFNVVFKPNNSEAVFAIQRIVPKEVFQDAKRILTEKMLAVNEFGLYRPFKGVSNFTKFDDDTLKTIYKFDELKDLRDLISISKRSLGAERIAGNPSGTAQSIITFESGRAVLRHPGSGSTYIILPNAIARLYLSQTGRKYFTSGFKLPGNLPSAASLATKLISIISGDGIQSVEE